MAKAELKTQVSDASVEDFFQSLTDAALQQDCRELGALMQSATGHAPRMWGSGIVGFGLVHLRYESGRELDWMCMGFAPRKGKLSLYLPGPVESYAPELARLGNHALGKGCIYLKSLAHADRGALEDLLRRGAALAAPR